MVLTCLQAAGIKLKTKKCNFMSNRVKFLGHEIAPDGLLPEPNKCVAISKWKTPGSKAMVKTFLGMSGYYQNFIPNYNLFYPILVWHIFNVSNILLIF